MGEGKAGAVTPRLTATQKQLDVLIVLARGFNQVEAAQILDLDITVVRDRLRHLKERLRCRTTFQLAFIAGHEIAKLVASSRC